MQRRYATADVFTNEPLGGNPVAVVLDSEGLTAAQMQALAAEFNYVETIRPPDCEIPFAGHPNIDTAFLLARERVMRGEPLPERCIFEEAAGLVTVDLIQEDGRIIGAELLSPQPLVRYTEVNPAVAAACLGVAPGGARPRSVSIRRQPIRAACGGRWQPAAV